MILKYATLRGLSHGTDHIIQWLTIGANLSILVGLVLVLVELNQNRLMMRAKIRHDLFHFQLRKRNIRFPKTFTVRKKRQHGVTFISSGMPVLPSLISIIHWLKSNFIFHFNYDSSIICFISCFNEAKSIGFVKNSFAPKSIAFR